MTRFLCPSLLLIAACGTTHSAAPRDYGGHLPPEVVGALEGASRLEILALDPMPAGMTGTEGPLLDEYPILDAATLTDAAQLDRLRDLLDKSLREGDQDLFAGCFNPRHGVRVEVTGGTVDLVICFECLQVQVHTPNGAASSAQLSPAVEREVTALYKAAGLSVAGTSPR